MPTGTVVRVAVPAKVYGNLEQMQTITRNVLGRFGCLGCHSGIDIRFVVEENFAVDENLNLTAVPFAVGGSD
ncbi:MAG: hypothetical protein WAN21_03990 [Candidatus Sulfotelmatobacter sp.]|jgi:hypothetical protein